jgi:xeroderma pigmentosum group C-complementing protein
MPPKRRGRPPKESNGRGIDSIDFGNTTDSSVVMSGRNSRSRAKGKGKASSSRNAVPDVYEEMLAEALPSQSDIPERPLKRRKTGRRDAPVAANSPAKPDQSDDVVVDEEDEDEDLEFEDVLDTAKDGDSENESNLPPKQVQTAYRDSDGEESGESDLEWEGIDFDAKPGGGEEPSGDLELILTVQPTPQRRAAAPRRKAVTNAERTLRLEIHRMHVLCLLSHLDRRNTWCNDPDVRSALEPLLDKKTLTYLNPKESLSQFGRAESLKRGLEMASVMWRTKFNITARGIRRALWADDEKDIQNVCLPNLLSFEEIR